SKESASRTVSMTSCREILAMVEPLRRRVPVPVTVAGRDRSEYGDHCQEVALVLGTVCAASAGCRCLGAVVGEGDTGRLHLIRHRGAAVGYLAGFGVDVDD